MLLPMPCLPLLPHMLLLFLPMINTSPPYMLLPCQMLQMLQADGAIATRTLNSDCLRGSECAANARQERFLCLNVSGADTKQACWRIAVVAGVHNVFEV
jgi:hypothetical protein